MTINEYQTLAMRTLNPALEKKDVLIGNIEKLRSRYPEGFDADKSINREERD